MKVTFKTKILAIALSGVALVSVPQSGYAASFFSEATGSAAEAFATNVPGGAGILSGIGTGFSTVNSLIGDYKNIMEQYSQASCAVSSGLGNSSLFGAATKEIKGFLGEQKGKIGGFGGKIIDNAIDGASDATRSRHQCIVDGRKQMMITAMQPYYTYKETSNSVTAEDYLTDFLADAAGDYLNEKTKGTFLGDHIDFRNVTGQAADCLGGEASVACGDRTAMAERDLAKAEADLKATDQNDPDYAKKEAAYKEATSNLEVAKAEDAAARHRDARVALYTAEGEANDARKEDEEQRKALMDVDLLGDDETFDNQLIKTREAIAEREAADAKLAAAKAKEQDAMLDSVVAESVAELD